MIFIDCRLLMMVMVGGFVGCTSGEDPASSSVPTDLTTDWMDRDGDGIAYDQDCDDEDPDLGSTAV